MVIAARTHEGLHLYRTIFRRLRELGYEGGDIAELDGADVYALEPAFDPDSVTVGLHAKVDRFVRPEQLTAGLASHLRESGTDVREDCELQGLTRRNGRIVLETTAG